ncbi:MAG: methyl-accepting chemotaxis protein [Pseudomonadota bacterium]
MQVPRLIGIDRLLPGEALVNADQALRSRVLAVSILLLTALSAAFGYLIGSLQVPFNWSDPATLVLFVCTGIGLFTSVYFRIFFHYRLVSLSVPVITLTAIFAMLSQFGLEHQSLWFLTVVPLISTILVGPRLASLFTTVAVTGILYFWWNWQDYLLAGNSYSNPSWHFGFHAGACITSIVVIHVISHLFEWQRQQAVAQATHSMAEFVRANAELSEALTQVELAKRSTEQDSVHKSEFIRKMTGAAASQGVALRSTRAAMAQMNELSRTIDQSAGIMARSAEDSSTAADQIAATTQGVMRQIESVVTTVDQTAASTDEMVEVIGHVAANVEALRTDVDQTSAAMQQMETSIAHVEQNASRTATLADDVIAHAARGSSSLQKTLKGVEAIRNSSAQASEVIRRLVDEIGSIGRILTVIEDVADQTKLLALNASIIAAQAGTEGRGFAVVAEEIKNLAARSADSTKEIGALVTSVQQRGREVIRAIDDGDAAVHAGHRQTQETEQVFAEIVTASASSNQMVQAIARSASEQARATASVALAMERIATAANQVAGSTREQKRGAQQLREATQHLRLVAEHVERSSREQAEGIQHILDALRRITELVQRVHEAQTDQTSRSAQVLDAVEEALASQLEQVESLELFGGSLAARVPEPRPVPGAAPARSPPGRSPSPG